ncbi:MAG: hypothetical protein ACKVRO_07035 [Micropepsaceae bacterium]
MRIDAKTIHGWRYLCGIVPQDHRGASLYFAAEFKALPMVRSGLSS